MVRGRIDATVRDSSSWDGKSLIFTINDTGSIPVADSSLMVRFYANQNPELYQQYLTREDFDVDFSEVKTKKETEELKQKILATKPQSKKEDYEKAIKTYNQARKEEQKAFILQDIARMVTYDLAAACEKGVSSKRYANIVEYARRFLRSVGTKTAHEEVKEPKRGAIQRSLDRFLERDSLHYTKSQTARLQKDFKFFNDEEIKIDFEEMAQNIPNEPMKSAVIHVKGCDPVASKFMDTYDNQAHEAMMKRSNAQGALTEELVKAIIQQDASDAFDEKYKAHWARIHAREQLLNKEKRKASTRGTLKKAAKAKRRNTMEKQVVSGKQISEFLKEQKIKKL